MGHDFLQDLLFDGHVVHPSQTVGDDEVLVPQRVHGSVLGRSARQVFARTSVTLEMGMCGGPVMDASTPNSCFGIVEGIVESDGIRASGAAAEQESIQQKAQALLGSAAVFVEAAEIADFLRVVEHQLARELR